MSKWATLTAFSLAQVYVAETLSSGLPVAVKVQYADLRERFDSDVATFKAILDGIEVMHPKFGFAWILDELSENMENELDFQVRPQCPGFFFAFSLLEICGETFISEIAMGGQFSLLLLPVTPLSRFRQVKYLLRYIQFAVA